MKDAATKTVLLVEDDADIRDTLQDLLEDEGFDVIPAANGKQAIDFLTLQRAPRGRSGHPRSDDADGVGLGGPRADDGRRSADRHSGAGAERGGRAHAAAGPGFRPQAVHPRGVRLPAASCGLPLGGGERIASRQPRRPSQGFLSDAASAGRFRCYGCGRPWTPDVCARCSRPPCRTAPSTMRRRAPCASCRSGTSSSPTPIRTGTCAPASPRWCWAQGKTPEQIAAILNVLRSRAASPR